MDVILCCDIKIKNGKNYYKKMRLKNKKNKYELCVNI